MVPQYACEGNHVSGKLIVILLNNRKDDCMKYCIYCGSEQIENESICHVCGAEVIDGIEKLDELVIRYLKGENEAFSEIYSITYGWVIKYISARIDVCDVEDCAQQLYLKLYNNIEKYNPESGKFVSWFKTLLSNCCKDFYRSVSRYNLHTDSMYDEEGKEKEFVDPGITPEQYIELKDIIKSKL